MSKSLPSDLYICEQVQALDREAIARRDGDGFSLMALAGQRAFDLLQSLWPDERHLTVFCGGGNNAGDGYVVAALAAAAGYQARVLYLVEPVRLTGDALRAFEQARDAGVECRAYTAEDKIDQGVIVDALLGIGVKGQVRDDYRAAINSINNSPARVLAVDTPSGICGDTGSVLGTAVLADVTITYIGMKRGLLTGAARDHTGELYYEALGVEAQVFATQGSDCQRLDFHAPLLPPRRANSHKGVFGRVLVLAGDHGFGGAGIMAAESALLSGAGIVSLATRPESVGAALSRRPELMVRATTEAGDIDDLLSAAQVLVLGPGLGSGDWSRRLLHEALTLDIPMVLDADGLNLLASEYTSVPTRNNWVLTPHPAEAARLLGTTTADVQNDRFKAAKRIQQKYGGTIVLKGAGTIIASHSDSEPCLSLCSAGNPAMSAPGMGDVLAGIIGGVLAQHMAPEYAASLAVWAHATAGDLAAKRLGKHLLASDLYSDLRTLW